MATPLSIEIYRGDELVETRDFERDIIKIGRLSSAHLRLDDSKVSRIHSVVEVGGDGDVSIIDMGSAVGTLVNGERVNKATLSDGDEIVVGDTRLVLKLGAAPAATEEAPAEEAAAAPAEEAPAEAAAAPAAEAPAAEAAPAPAEEAAPAAEAPAEEAAPEPEAPAAEAPAPTPEATPQGVPGQDLAGAPLPPPSMEFDPRVFVEAELPPGSAPSPDNRAVEVRFLWGDVTLAVSHLKNLKTFTIGEGKKANFYVDSEVLDGVEEFTLLDGTGTDVSFTFTAKMSGLVNFGGKVMTLKDLVDSKQASSQGGGAFSAPMPPDARVMLDIGAVTVLIRFVPPPRPVAVSWTEGLDYNIINLLLISLFMHMALIITAINFPYDTDVIADDLFSQPNRFAKLLLKPPDPVKNERFKNLLDAMKKKDPGEAAAKAKGAEGKMGRKNKPDTKKRSAPKAIDIKAKELVANSGVFKMLKSGGAAGVSTVFGEGGLGGDLNGALGGLVGSAVGDSGGMGGLGLRGSGGGGGGLSGTTFGVGGIGTKGRGGGLGGYGSGVGGLGSKKDSNINISQGNPTVMGSLDKELIRKVIRSHIAQVRYCYERELQTNPSLFGKVAVKFTITATGKVSTAKVATTTMNNPKVESCLESRVKSWTFPKPKGGGIVIVTYPFVFKQSG